VQSSWDTWWVYRDNRNKTSHSYNLNVVLDIMQSLDDFHLELVYLLNALQPQNDTEL